MPEISTQTDPRDMIEPTKSYLNLLLTFKFYSQNCVKCKYSERPFQVNFLNKHRKDCKLCKEADYLNCR